MRRVGLDWIGARPSGRSLIWVTGGPAGPDMGREDLAVRPHTAHQKDHVHQLQR